MDNINSYFNTIVSKKTNKSSMIQNNDSSNSFKSENLALNEDKTNSNYNYDEEEYSNIDESSNALDLGLAIDVAKYFKLNSIQANNILQEMKVKIKEWNLIAKKIDLILPIR